jgi:hypothetical protein
MIGPSKIGLRNRHTLSGTPGQQFDRSDAEGLSDTLQVVDGDPAGLAQSATDPARVLANQPSQLRLLHPSAGKVGSDLRRDLGFQRR